jgi:CubicO group peptidase (beta-lactamase class C family)
MRAFFITTLVAGLTLAGPASAEWPSCGRVDAFPGNEWRQARPGRHGWDPEQLERARQVFASQPSAAVMVVHRGRLIAAWGDVGVRYTAQSVRKALLSSLVGQLVADGALRLDATLEDMNIDDVSPPLTSEEREATLADLLRSRSGIFHSALYEVGGWTRMRRDLAEREAQAGRDLYPHGAYWIYNNWDFNALGTIVERAAGEDIGPLFARRVANPTRMQDFQPEHVEYTTSGHPAEQRFGNVSSHRAYVFDISTRDLARYGLLYLNCGRWGRTQVVPRDWVLASIDGPDTREGRGPDEQNTGFGGYGYLWQIDRPGMRRYATLSLSDPSYFATGHRGHVLGVFPELDLVIAHQVATVGGVGMEAQSRRAREGSPEVSEDQVAALFAEIIRAHPEADAAFAAE